MLEGNGAAVYHPRQPQQSPLWKLLDDHFEGFERDYDQKFFRIYGYQRAVIADAVRAYLKCGDLREGFARVRCPDCHHEYLLAFSCRGAGSARAVTPKRSFSSANCYARPSSVPFRTVSTFLPCRRSCVSTSSTIANC